MNLHPALSMLSVWLLCIAAYLILPFQLTVRQLTWQGGVVFVIFVSAFVLGTLLVPSRMAQLAGASKVRVDARYAYLALMIASLLASTFLLLDASQKALFDLNDAYQQRSDTAEALLRGEMSSSSIWFKIAFMLYPAGYVFMAVHSLFSRRLSAARLALFGLLPVVLATVVMGGRSPVLYAALLLWLCLRERRKFAEGHSVAQAEKSTREKWLTWLLWVAALCMLLYYFAAVFVARANLSGGATAMFAIAEERWGVNFRGPFSSLIFAVLGDEVTYLVFIFIWYVVQGFVMSNYLFSAYDGPAQAGIYGLDLMTAVMRVLAPENVAIGFDSLLKLGTYGFFPSAWGSLYVDFSSYSIVICLAWGVFAALVYRRVVIERRVDWALWGPFVTIGIVFSFINTPFGFTNGLVTHAWLLFAFLLLRRRIESVGGEVAR